SDPRPVLYDWQSNSAGAGGVDLGSLLPLWAEPATAAAGLDELLSIYRGGLGDDAPPPDQVRRAYELGLAHWFLRGVQASQSPSPLEMIESLAVRTTWALASVDARRLLAG